MEFHCFPALEQSLTEEKETSLSEVRKSLEEEKERLREELAAQLDAKDSTIQENMQKSENQQETEVNKSVIVILFESQNWALKQTEFLVVIVF